MHYNPSREVKDKSEIEDAAKELLALTNTVEIAGKTPYALHHAQVTDEPYAFFTIHNDFLEQLGTKNPVVVNLRILEVESKSLRDPEEGCMSAPHRKHISVPRYMEITVEYEIPTPEGMETTREQCTGLKAQIFQHEFDHQNGKNIYWSK